MTVVTPVLSVCTAIGSIFGAVNLYIHSNVKFLFQGLNLGNQDRGNMIYLVFHIGLARRMMAE
jgi:hypothetical protein